MMAILGSVSKVVKMYFNHPVTIPTGHEYNKQFLLS